MAKIYLSSTYSDLKDFREEAYRALRKLGHDVIAMEDYIASDERPLDKCLADVDCCDVYVGLFAWRYGYIPPEQEKSITELEFRTAANGKKCLIFMLDDTTPWSPALVDKESERIDALRAELKKDFMVDSSAIKTSWQAILPLPFQNCWRQMKNPLMKILLPLPGSEKRKSS